MLGMMTAMMDKVKSAATGRNPKFYAREREFLKANPRCAGCGRASQTAHHSIPFHIRPDLEMDETLWVPFCRDCHFVDGHSCNWNHWVKDLKTLLTNKINSVCIRKEDDDAAQNPVHSKP